MFPCKNLTGVFAYLLAFPGNFCDSYKKKKKRKEKETKYAKDKVIFLLVFFPPLLLPLLTVGVPTTFISRL